jgi:hypothetical protein
LDIGVLETRLARREQVLAAVLHPFQRCADLPALSNIMMFRLVSLSG